MPTPKTPSTTRQLECVGGGRIDGVIVDISEADPRNPFVDTDPVTGTRSIYALVRVEGHPAQLVFLGHEAARVAR